MLKESKFLGNSFIYIVGTLLSQGVNFLTFIILGRMLSPDNFAFISLYGLFVNVCLSFVSLQGASSVNNALVEYGEKKLNSYVFSVSILSIFVSCVTVALVLIFRDAVENFVGFPTLIIIMMVIQAAISSFASLQMENNRVRKKALPTVFWNSAIPVLRVFLSVVFIIFLFDYSYTGDIYGFFTAAMIIGLAAIVITVYNSKLKFKLSYIKFCLPITVPIIFHAVSGLILTGTDKYMLVNMLGETEMGIYSFIFNIALIPTGIWIAINNAWTVEYFEKLKLGDNKSITALTNSYMKYIFCAYVLILLVLPEVIRVIASPEYYPGIAYSPFIVAGGFFMFLYTICSVHQTYSKRTIFIPIATLISAAINVGLNFLFIPLYGAFGAAISSIISFGVLFLLHFIFSGVVIRNFPIRFLRMAIPAALIVCVATLVSILIDYMLVRLMLAAVFGSISIFSFMQFIRKNRAS